MCSTLYSKCDYQNKCCTNLNCKHTTDRSLYKCLIGDCGKGGSVCDINVDGCCLGYACGLNANTYICLPTL